MKYWSSEAYFFEVMSIYNVQQPHYDFIKIKIAWVNIFENIKICEKCENYMLQVILR